MQDLNFATIFKDVTSKLPFRQGGKNKLLLTHGEVVVDHTEGGGTRGVER